MDTVDTASGASGGEGSADNRSPEQQGQSPQQQTTPDQAKPKVVSWDVAEQYKSDMFRFKEKARDLEAKLGDVESQRLKEKEDYKTLYEREKETAEAAVKKADDLSGFVKRTQQFNSVKDLAIQAGLRGNAIKDLELLDFDPVKVEVTNTGRFHVDGAKEFVERIKADRPHWFQEANAPSVNSGRGGAADPQPSSVSRRDMVQAEKDYRRGVITKDKYRQLYSSYVTENKNSAK